MISILNRISSINSKLFSTPASGRLCVFRRDPIALALYNSQARWFVVWLLTILILLTPKITISSLNGTLTSPSLAADFNGDMLRFPPLDLAFDSFVAIWDVVGDASPVIDLRQNAAETSNSLPYLRDYSDIFLVTWLSLLWLLILTQWIRISDILVNLSSKKAFNPEVIADEEIARITTTFDRRFNNPWAQAITLALAVFSAFAVWKFAFSSYGLYSGLSPIVESRAWEIEAYLNSWYLSDGAPNYYLISWQIFTYSFFFYYVLMHIYIGIILVWLMVHTHFRYAASPLRRFNSSVANLISWMMFHSPSVHNPSNNGPLFLIQPDHPDGASGLGLVKQIFAYVIVSIIMSSVALTVGVYYLPSETAGFHLFFLRIPFVFVIFYALYIFNPLFVILPLFYIRSQLKLDKTMKMETMYAEIQNLQDFTGHGSPGEPSDTNASSSLRLLLDQYETLRKSPTILFSVWRLSFLSVAYLVATLKLLETLQNLLSK